MINIEPQLFASPKDDGSGTESATPGKGNTKETHVVPSSPSASPEKKAMDDPKEPSKASADESSTTTTTPVKKRRAKKPDDMPRRPLSAYNIFFQNQRRMIVNGDVSVPSLTLPIPRAPRATGCRKRLHRKMHGKIGFVDLAKTIGKRWRSLSDEEKKPYLKLAGKNYFTFLNNFCHFKLTSCFAVELEKAKYHEEMKIYTFKKKNPLWFQRHHGNHDIASSMRSSEGAFSTQHLTVGGAGTSSSNYQHSFPNGSQNVLYCSDPIPTVLTSFQQETRSQPSSYLQTFHQVDSSRPDVYTSNSYDHEAFFSSHTTKATTHLQTFANEIRRGYEKNHQKEFQPSLTNNFQPEINHVTPRSDTFSFKKNLTSFSPTPMREAQNDKRVGQQQSSQHTGSDVSTHDKRFDINFNTIFDDEPSDSSQADSSSNLKNDFNFEPYPYLLAAPSTSILAPLNNKVQNDDEEKYERHHNKHEDIIQVQAYPNYSLLNQYNGGAQFQSPRSSNDDNENSQVIEFTNDDIVEFLQPLFSDNMEAV